MSTKRWFREVSADPTDFGPLAEALAFYIKEIEAGRQEIQVKGKRIDDVAARLSGIVEYRYGQLQDLEIILQYVEKLEERAIVEKTQWYMSHYNRNLSESTAKRYAENHDDVFVITRLKLETAAVRNDYLALFKALEYMHFQISNITRLRAAGVEDSTF